MYAISFDLDTKVLADTYPVSLWQNAYADIGKSLRGHGFTRQQGSVYLGDETVDAVRCQTAVQSLALEYEWFAPSVSDIRMLRIEDNNDLAPAIDLILRAKASARG